MKKRARIAAILMLATYVLPLPLCAQSSPNLQPTIFFNIDDRNNYIRALRFAANGDEVALDAAIATISDKTLVPILQRELLLKKARPSHEALENWLLQNRDSVGADLILARAQSLYPDTQFQTPTIWAAKRGFARIRQLRKNADEHAPNASPAQRAQFIRARALFYANDDYGTINAANSQLDGAFSGKAAWYGGLAAYRIGDFDAALRFFTITANWQFGDDYTKTEAACWAARAAAKLGHNEIEGAMLEIAAAAPLSFYGQLALTKLGRWQNFNVPTDTDTATATREILANFAGARRALALFDLGLTTDAQNELAQAWNSAPSKLDVGFIFIAANLGFVDLSARISEVSNAATLINLYPIANNIAPQGGSFVLDRALIYAVMRQESRFNSSAVSYAGARGLMQLMPATAAWMTGRSELRQNPALLHDNQLNLTLGEGYLERVMKMDVINNSIARTLMAYNAGPGSVSRWARNIEMSEDTLMLIEATPVTQTREYVKHVMCNLWIYHKRLGQNAPTLERLAQDKSPIYEPQDNPRATGNRVALMRQ